MKKALVLPLLLAAWYLSAQKVGVNTTTPAEHLDVNGNINLSGKLKVNGVAGEANQLLMTNATGATAWGNLCEYPSFILFRRTTGADQYFTVPAGITKLYIELWGAGGGGSAAGGGGGGAYSSFVVNCTAGQIFTISAGTGGGPGNTEATAGTDGSETIVLQLAAGIDLRAGGGFRSNPVDRSPGIGAYTYKNTGSISSMFIGGSPGRGTRDFYTQRSSTEFVTIKNYGDGGDAGLLPGTGAAGGFRSYNTATTILINYNQPSFSSQPGGGGGGGPYGAIWGSYGASGQAVIHY